MAILDPVLIAEFAAIIATGMQAVKSHPKVKGSMIPWLSGIAGAGVGLGWYLVSGELKSPDALLHIDWADVYRGVFNGVAGAVTANTGYNIQKILPIPNVLPTASELDQQTLKETVKTQEMVVQAVAEGVPPKDAKEDVGLAPTDPPPLTSLETVAPTPTEVVQDMADDAQNGSGATEDPKVGQDITTGVKIVPEPTGTS